MNHIYNVYVGTVSSYLDSFTVVPLRSAVQGSLCGWCGGGRSMADPGNCPNCGGPKLTESSTMREGIPYTEAQWRAANDQANAEAAKDGYRIFCLQIHAPDLPTAIENFRQHSQRPLLKGVQARGVQ